MDLLGIVVKTSNITSSHSWLSFGVVRDVLDILLCGPQWLMFLSALQSAGKSRKEERDCAKGVQPGRGT